MTLVANMKGPLRSTIADCILLGDHGLAADAQNAKKKALYRVQQRPYGEYPKKSPRKIGSGLDSAFATVLA